MQLFLIETKSSLKPILKWAGNKQNTPIVDRVKELFEPYRKTTMWVEPYCGVLGMTLSIMPDRALLLDGCEEIVMLHQWIRESGRLVQLPEKFTEEQYYWYRDEFNKNQLRVNDPFAVVEDFDRFFSLMIWLNRACYNGLWRVNQKGLFNVPVGKNSKGELPIVSMPNLEPMQELLNKKSWIIGKSNLENIDKVLSPESLFIYADPPYWGTHSSYVSQGFDWEQQKRLAKWLESKGCPVVASNSNHPEIISLYELLGFTIELIPVKRSISSNGDRKPAMEMLAYLNV